MNQLIEAARAALETNGGPIGADSTIDGHEYVMVRRDAFDAIDAAMAAAEAQPEPAPHAMQQLTAALQADPDYAWSWHCNLAMPIMDATGVTHRVANEAGARLMRHLFDIDITKHPHYRVEAAAEAQPTPFTPDWAGYRQGVADGKAEAQPAPAGWKLVPVEPSIAMTMAAHARSREFDEKNAPLRRCKEIGDAEIVYRAMLAASPAAPAQDLPDVMGMPFSEARQRILELDAESACGMAISLLIQQSIAAKYAAPAQAPLTDEAILKLCVEAFVTHTDPLGKDNMTLAFGRAIERAVRGGGV